MTEKEIKLLGIEDLIVRDLRPDSKYSLIQGRVLHQEKNYLIPLDEPVYVTVGFDPTAKALAEHYNYTLLGETQSNIVVDHIKSSNNRIIAFNDFANQNEVDMGEIELWLEYPASQEEQNRVDEANAAINTIMDGKQSTSFFFYDFKLFDRASRTFISPEVPIMIYRGKDALLVQIIKDHIELIKANEDFYSEDTFNLLLKNAESSIATVHKFHTEKPERCGVTCSLFTSQEAKGSEYKEAMSDNAKYLELQKKEDG